MTYVFDKVWRFVWIIHDPVNQQISSIMIITENDGDLGSISLYLRVSIPSLEILF